MLCSIKRELQPATAEGLLLYLSNEGYLMRIPTGATKLVNVIVCDHVTIKKIVLLWREAKRRLLLWQLIIVEKRHCYCYDTHAHSGLSIVVRTPIPSPSTLVFTVLAKKCLTTTVSLT